MIDKIISLEIEPEGVKIGVDLEFELGEIRASFMLDIVGVLEKLAERTDNQIDDVLVEMVGRALYPD